MPLPQIKHPQKENPTERRIVLLGKTGAGKSASANTILGEKRFRSEFSLSSVTVQCECEQAKVAERMVSVVDTPALFEPSFSNELLGSSVYLSSPGPHALLYVIKPETFTAQEEDVVQFAEKIFGKEVRKYMMILFTCEDQLEGQDMDDQIKTNKPLSRLIDQCGGGYHVFNNKDQSNRAQVNELMEKIDKMVDKNEGSYYSVDMFKEAYKCKQESGFSTFCQKYKDYFKLAAALFVVVIPCGVIAGCIVHSLEG